MLTLYHLENSRSQRLIWLLEELGVDYLVERADRDPNTMLGPKDQKKVHPLGKWPVLQDGDLTLAETAAIGEYLNDRYGNGAYRLTAQDAGYEEFLHWFHFAEGSIQPLLIMRLIFTEMPKRAPALVRPIIRKANEKVLSAFVGPRLNDQLGLIEEHLTGREWFAGDRLTLADIMMSFPLEAVFSRGQARGEYPNVERYLRAIHRRPAYLAALEKGGAYAFAPLS